MASSMRSLLGAAPALGLLLLSACGDKTDARLEKLSVGISKDSVLVIMGVDKPQRVDAFLVGQYIEAMYFTKAGAADSASVADRNMSPLVVMDGKLVAWGWKQWDSIAAEKKIPVVKE